MRRSFWPFLAIICWMIASSSGAFGITADDLKPLAEDDYDAKSQALDRVIASGDEAGLRLLEALDKENVVATAEDQVLIQDGKVLKDPLTNAPVSVSADDVQSI